jgi:hypothetical protein
LKTFNILYFLSIVKLCQVESLHDCGASQLSQVSSDFVVFHLPTSGDIVIVNPRGVLVEGRLNFVKLLAVSRVGV